MCSPFLTFLKGDTDLHGKMNEYVRILLQFHVLTVEEIHLHGNLLFSNYHSLSGFTKMYLNMF